GRSSRPIKRILIVALAAGLTAVLLAFNELDTYLWPGLVYAVLFAAAVGLLEVDRRYRLLCVLAGVVLFMTPLGSNNGIYNAIYALHLAVPVALIALITHCQAQDEEEKKRLVEQSPALWKRFARRSMAA